MGPLKLEQFGGCLPAWDDRLLPAGQAASSNNAYLFSGALSGWRKPKVLRSTSGKYVYRVPTITKATAHGYLLLFAQPSQGDTFTIGEERYTFTATVTNPYDVLIGAALADSANNAFAALTIGTGAGTLYGEGTCLNPALSAITGVIRQGTASGKPYIYVEAPDEGAAPNTTAFTESTSGVRLFALSNPDDTGSAVSTLIGGVNPTFDNNIAGDSKWLDFDDPDTSVMRSAVVNDRFGRYYFSSPSLPPKYNTYDRIQNDQSAFLLGLNPPGCAPIVSVTGGGDALQMGYPTNTVGGTFSFAANSIYLVQITPTAAIELEDVAFMPNETLTTAKFAAVLYDDRAGVPFELINVGNVVVGAEAAVQVTSQFTNPTGLLAGVKYWIGVMTDTILTTSLSDGSSAGVSFADTFNNGPPTFAGTVTTGLPTMQIWGDCTTGSVISARSYVYTWVSAYGEESAPSPFTLVNGWSNGTWDITLWTPPTDDMGVLRNITKLRLYRTVTSAAGSAVFFFVKELDIGTLAYTDVGSDLLVARNNILPSSTWFPPPESLQNIVSMPNGMAVGFRGNEIWFAEPYQPHAWPPNYVLTTEFPIIGLGISGNAVIAVTSGTPYVAQGVNPASMSLTKTTVPEPCISRASILADDGGIYYISPNGLILVTQYGQVTNTTELWITREKWRALTPSKNLRAIRLSSCYFCFGTVNGSDTSVAQAGFYIELNPADAQSFTIWPQPGGHRVGFNTLTSPIGEDIDNVLVDPWTGIGLLIADGSVHYYDFSDTAPEITPYKWRSKVYQQNTKKSFGAMKVYFKVPPGTPTQNPVRDESDTDDTDWNTLPTDKYGIIRVYASHSTDPGDVMELVTVRELRASGELMRILGGFKAESWQWEIEGRVEITNVQAAGTVKELAAV